MTEISSGPTTFEPGDIVQLKSFGPAMTVIAVNAEGVHVLWYGEVNDEVKTHVIPAIALEKITVLDDEDDEDEDEDDEDDEDDDEDEDNKERKRLGKKKRSRVA
jgi:uncharacterized protein YodC (DUF2158 family)